MARPPSTYRYSQRLQLVSRGRCRGSKGLPCSDWIVRTFVRLRAMKESTFSCSLRDERADV